MIDEKLKTECKKYFSDIRLYRYYEMDKNYLKIYFYNLNISEKLLSMISIFEIILRNKIHEILVSNLSEDYLINPNIKIFNKYEHKLIERAHEKSISMNLKIKESKILSSLTLGFWCNLLKNNYLWCKFLNKIYSKRVRRSNSLKLIIKKIDLILKIRNMIAHHERIIKKPGICIEETIKCITDSILLLIDPEDTFFLSEIRDFLLGKEEEIRICLEAASWQFDAQRHQGPPVLRSMKNT